MRAKEYFNHLRKRDRIAIFFRTKRRRFLYLFLFILAFNFFGNAVGFLLARMERSARKYKKLWIMDYNPAIMSYHTAVDTLYVPMKLSQQSTDKLGEIFLRLDRQLKDGVSRGLLIKALRQSGLITEGARLREIVQNGSPYNTLEGQVRYSLSMKEYFKIVEGLVKDDHSDELEKVNLLATQLEQLESTFDASRD